MVSGISAKDKGNLVMEISSTNLTIVWSSAEGGNDVQRRDKGMRGAEVQPPGWAAT